MGSDVEANAGHSPLGVPFLTDVLAVVCSQGQVPREWFDTVTAVLDALGLGAETGLRLIYENASVPERFVERAYTRLGGSPTASRVGLANDLVSGGSPSGERARLIDAVEAAPPTLGHEDIATWRRDGYVVVRDAAPPEACRRLADAIWSFVDADPDDPDSWYGAVLPQGIMVPLHDAPGVAEIHDSLRIRRAFVDLLGSADLVMTADRCGFSAPLRPGRSWTGPRLHHDLPNHQTPVAVAVQGILYLTDTGAEQGPLRVVPGFHHRVDAWLEALPPGRDPSLEDLEAFGAVPVPAPAGSLVIWHHALPHGPAVNTGALPRLVHYLSMYTAPAPVVTLA